MSFYRKKPVVIEAVQLGWDTWSEICDFASVGQLSDGKPMGCYINEAGEAVEEFPGQPAKIGLWIPTLEGLMVATEGDWIIKGVSGEFYPCKPDIFEQTYELVRHTVPDLGMEVLDLDDPEAQAAFLGQLKIDGI